jgi:hypothetical protein
MILFYYTPEPNLILEVRKDDACTSSKGYFNKGLIVPPNA